MKTFSATGRDTGRRPVILVTPDIRTAAGAEREFAVRTNYAEAIGEAGGVPLILPYEAGTPDAVLTLADGILLTGTIPGLEAGPDRRIFELGLIDRALDRGMPLLGICNGMQLIGEALGGRVIRDAPDLLEEVSQHIPQPVPDRLAHAIVIEPATKLFALHGADRAEVNSLHRHKLDGFGRYHVAARAPDGVVEAIEGLGDTFCMGVQWHPEYRLTPLDRAIMGEFVASCAAYADAGREF